MIEAVRSVLGLIAGEQPADRARLEALAAALDQLAAAYHRTPDEAPGGSVEPPSQDHAQLRGLVCRSFPQLGFYRWVPPEIDPARMDPARDPTTIGDAADDLTDIIRDLRNVAWCWDNAGSADAAWCFRLGFQAHWGRHLCNLRSYIHAALHEGLTASGHDRTGK